jgi:ribosomal protein S18 acetylase RimI-like enzyme
MIEHPSHKDKFELRSIWKDVFHDSDGAIDLFFRNTYSKHSALIYRSGGTIGSMIFFPEYDFKHGSYWSKLGYLCGAATLPEYRNKGIMGQLMARSFEIMKARGYEYASLIPASDSLYNYYERFGFSDFFYRKKYSVGRADLLPGHLYFLTEEANLDKIFKTYSDAVSGLPSVVVHSRKSYATAIADIYLSGGEVLTSEESNLYCFVIREGSAIFLKEMFCSLPGYDPYPDLIRSLFEHYPDSDTIFVEGPVDFVKAGSDIFRTGMLRSLSGKHDSDLNAGTTGYMSRVGE